MSSGVRIEIRGTVQGVGFRPWVYRVASEEGVAGRIRNDASGVTIDAFGDDGAIHSFLRRLETSAPPAAEVRELRWAPIPPEDLREITITASHEGGERSVSIPPDLATCAECAGEIADASNRRHRYPFTNCTNCGPRFTISRDIPYDRAATTMAAFAMCDDCRREYESVADRRFHAQPNACPVCGPRLVATSARGVELEGDPIALAAGALRDGLVVAVKGLGGFHLACDATSPEAVTRLRVRKRRDAKPLAVMVPDLAMAQALADLSPAEIRMLTSVERPIVLAKKRPAGPLADEIAPRNELVGVMLPYTPLHHLLLAEVDAPLVMTSGNLSEEPIARDNAEALRRLGGIADLFLLHDREIETRCDDSVTRVIAGRPVILRRSRGYVPRPLVVSRRFETPVLACGAHLKNTFAFASGDKVTLGPHIGDLENLETLESYEQSIARMQRFLEVRPEVVAYDLHPGYLSTRYALARPEAVKIAVQHHHAHVAGAMAEHGIDGPALGIAYDGTGYGLDGSAWGGEILVAEYHRFERIATLRPIALAGGDTAIRQVWRIALAVLLDAYDGAPPLTRFPLFASVDPAGVDVAQRMIATRCNTASAHGAGRWFDAFGALFLGRAVSRYEGEVSLEWNLAAGDGADSPYPFDLDAHASPWEIDLRPTVRAAVDDFTRGVSVATISGRFHETLAQATACAVEWAARRHGAMPVVFSGGCFQNALLVERLTGLLSSRFTVLGNTKIPPGDGGIAFGQAVVADAIFRHEGGS